jgi:hypothetical protein
MFACPGDQGLCGLVVGLHPDPHALAEVTLGRRRCEGAVRGEDTVVDEPGGGVELGEESLDAPAEPVGRVGDGLEDGGANDGLRKKVSGLKA